MAQVSHKSLFNKFRDTQLINKCEQYAFWTLPYLTADTEVVSSSGRVVVERDFQEIGALLVNNLSSKLARILFPTQYPFFQASASKAFLAEASKQGFDEKTVRAQFAQMEMKANERLFINSGYASLILMLKHLIVTGNVLLYRNTETGEMCAWGIQNFATRRDGQGKLLDAVLREFTTVEALPEAMQVALRTAQRSMYSRPEQAVEKYTRIHRSIRGGVVGYEVSQEVDTIPTGDASWYPANLCPWMCPTWILIPGEHHGRGMVEEYAGGFASLSSLSESAALYGVEMMRVLHLVGAGGGGDIDDLAEAESGEWRRGDPNQIQVHEAGDAQKLEACERRIQAVIGRLAKAFMYQGATRDAERVTAYELQRDAQEAESTLGGVYSTLSGQVQVPLAHILMAEASDIALPGMISGDLLPDVTAGIPALGRSAAVQNLLMAAQELGAIYPIAQLDKRINPQRLVDLVFAGRSIDPTTVYYTPAEQKANAEAQAATEQGTQSLLQAQSLSDQQQQINQTLGG